MNFNSTNGFLETIINLDTKLLGTQIFALQKVQKVKFGIQMELKCLQLLKKPGVIWLNSQIMIHKLMKIF